MKASIQTPGTFFIEGREYDQEGLNALCGRVMADIKEAAWKKEVFEFISLFLDHGKPAIRQLTSGTTGDPKEFLLDREAMISSAERTLAFFGLQKDQSALLCLPVRYIAGKLMVVRALVGGLNLLLAEPGSRPLQYGNDQMERVRRKDKQIDFCAMVPLQLSETLRHEDDLSPVKSLLLGGGEIHPALRNTIKGISGTLVYESFGSTETYTHFALKRLNGPEPDNYFRIMEGVRVSADEKGRLEVDIRGITRGKLQTNDLVNIGRDKLSFQWTGRFDNIINTGGIKVSPEPLEQKISDILDMDCLILPEQDEKLGRSLVLLIGLEGGPVSWEYRNVANEPDRIRPGDQKDRESPGDFEIIRILKRQLAKYEIPRRIVRTKKIPRNKSFKPDRIKAMELL